MNFDPHGRLAGVHPDLVRVIHQAANHVEFLVVQGVRSKEECSVNWGKGRSAAQCEAAGIAPSYAKPKAAKVTWLAHPFGSKHCKQKDGFGHAVDLLPAPYDWKAGFDGQARVMLAAAKDLGVHVTWGGSWAKSPDRPHFELGVA
jgi:peptidoglycan L-alanyl-D-glutamate endopeptidase CwlK